MHKSSYMRMKYFVETYLLDDAEDSNREIHVLDIGSQDVNGTYCKPSFIFITIARYAAICFVIVG